METALACCRKGENVFITGPGGTGKSRLILQIEEEALASGKEVVVCALTGCAAVLLSRNATTLHSWAGIGLSTGEIRLTKTAQKRWKKTDVLIVDEVSMLSRELFDVLDDIGKRVRGNDRLFGGIQLVFAGDFFQLPPVNGEFCFKSPKWVFETVLLTEIFRQKDPVYQKCLNEIRKGVLSKKSYDALCSRVIPSPEGATRLVPLRSEADAINEAKYKALPAEEHVFEMQVTAGCSETDYLEKHIRVGKIVRLKVGSRVMCVANILPLLCNGSQGVIVAFREGFPVVDFYTHTCVVHRHTWSSGKSKSSVSQIPLAYAWALTIHKSQGATLDLAEINVGSNVFAAGQIYVALSRITALAGLFLNEFDPSKISVNSDVLKFYEKVTTK